MSRASGGGRGWDEFEKALGEEHDGLALVDPSGRIVPLDDKARSILRAGARFSLRKASFDSSKSRGELEVQVTTASGARSSLYRISVVRLKELAPGPAAILRLKKIGCIQRASKESPSGDESRRSIFSGTMGIGERFLKVLFALYFADDMRELLNILLECVCESIGVEMAVICLFDEASKNLEVAASFGLNLTSARLAIPIADLSEKSFLSSGHVFERTFYIDPLSGFPYAEELARAGIGSIAVAPLVGGDGMIGLCALLSPSKRDFSGREISLIKSFGERLGAAAKAGRSRWKRLADESFLGGVNVASAVIDADGLRILSANPVFTSLFGIAEGDSALNALPALENLDLAKAVAEVIDSANTRTFLGCRCAAGAWVNTYWTALLAVDKFSPSQRVSTVAFLAVEVTLEVEAERRAERYAAQLATVQRMGITLGAESDLQSLLEKVAEAAAELVDAENCAIALDLNGEWAWVALHSKGDRGGPWSRSAVWRSIKRQSACVKLLKRRSPVRFTALSSVGPMRAPESHLEPAAFLAVPLLGLGGEVTGRILLCRKRGATSFSEADEGSMVIFAAQAASLIQRVRELERERGTVEILSEALTPKVPRIEGVDVDVAYRSSSKTGFCGDFLDFIEFDDGKIGLVVGDVCGRGVEAATMAVMARYVMRTFACEGKPPALVLERSNEVIKAQLPLGRFVTAFYGVLDPKTGFLRYAIAGHPPPFVFNRRTGGVRLFDFGSIPLGIFDNVEFSESSLRLTRDEVLVVYTDGLSEARRGQAFFGEARMFEVVEKSGSSWSRVAESLVDEAIRFSGGMEDDIAVVAMSLIGD